MKSIKAVPLASGFSFVIFLVATTSGQNNYGYLSPANLYNTGMVISFWLTLLTSAYNTIRLKRLKESNLWLHINRVILGACLLLWAYYLYELQLFKGMGI